MNVQYLSLVEGRAELLPGVCLLYLHCPELEATAQAGQFVMVRCGESYDPYLRYPLPIHRFIPRQGIALFFRPTIADRGLAWLGSRQVGDRVDLIGPCGHGFDLPPAREALSLVSWGAGLAPLLGILDRAAGPLRLISQVPTSHQVYPRELLPRQVEYLPCIGQGGNQEFWQAVEQSCHWGERLYGAAARARDVGQAGAAYGRLRQLVGATPLGLRRGAAQVWVEAEMACGIGLCRGCLLPTRSGPRRACTDGPVFDLLDLI